MPLSSIRILIPLFAAAISIHDSDEISVEVGGFHCSSIDSILNRLAVMGLVVMSLVVSLVVIKVRDAVDK